MRRIVSSALLVLLLLMLVPALPVSAAAPGNELFSNTWTRTDEPVAVGQVRRTWMWGPEADTDVIQEVYYGAPGNLRAVQYFDKSRMEITHPEGDRTSAWYVTNGLLAKELITGEMQLGDTTFIAMPPAEINVAGDPDDPAAPTYAIFHRLLNAVPYPGGAVITRRLARDGTVTDDPSLATRGVTVAQHVQVPGLNHQIASPFWDFMNSKGTIDQGGSVTQGPLFPNPYYATGYPITDSYWARVKVAGTARDVLMQCFERRCLTYTPDNPKGWQVEAGNVGQHYERWRYGDTAIHQRNQVRAATAYAAMQQRFYLPDVQLYRGGLRGSSPGPQLSYAYHWPFSLAVAGTLGMFGVPEIGSTYLPDVQARLSGGNRYWDTRKSPPGYDSYVVPPLGDGGDLYYDDNAWTGLNLVEHYRLTGDHAALARAQQVFDLLVSGWDTDPSHPAPGGVFWTQAPGIRDRNTVSNAPAAELGLHLYELIDDDATRAQDLQWARRMYDWVNTYMRAENGLFWDHIDLQGNIEKTQWSYNQGAMIGANVLFYRITRDPEYLARARSIANAAQSFYGDGDRLFAQGAPFNAIYFKNLLLLYNEDHSVDERATMQAYADRVWDTRRGPKTNIITLSDPVDLIDQGAIVQIYALLGWNPVEYGRLA